MPCVFIYPVIEQVEHGWKRDGKLVCNEGLKIHSSLELIHGAQRADTPLHQKHSIVSGRRLKVFSAARATDEPTSGNFRGLHLHSARRVSTKQFSPVQSSPVQFSPVQFGSLHIRTVIFAFPLSKVVDGTKRTAPYRPLYSLALCRGTQHTDLVLEGGAGNAAAR